MPVAVWKKITKLQRNFLWGGVMGGRKVCWVNWRTICNPKEKGGLGVRDVRAVNLSLLAKWRWRLLQEGVPLWKEVLLAKYGGGINMLEGGREVVPYYASRWWKDVVSLEKVGEVNWFNRELIRMVGNGENTSFWSDVWVGEVALGVSFPRLYSISNQKEGKIGEMGEWSGSNWNWVLTWRHNLFVWEEKLLFNLLTRIGVRRPSQEVDRWKWRLEDNRIFSVKSMYKALENLLILEEGSNPVEEKVFGYLWKSPAPSKVVAFSWKLLRDRTPTRRNLAFRNLLHPEDSINCVFCDSSEESSTHLFLHCRVISNIWRKIMDWLNFNFITPNNLFVHLECWSGEVRDKKMRKGVWLIWHAIIWVIWKGRNERIFNNLIKEEEELVEEIKVFSWRWVLSRLNVSPCLFYEWWTLVNVLRGLLKGRGMLVGGSTLVFIFNCSFVLCWVVSLSLERCCCCFVRGCW